MQYLLRRGDYWSFQIAIPRDLRPAFGRAQIVEALHTDSLALAKRLRDARLAHWRNQFSAKGPASAYASIMAAPEPRGADILDDDGDVALTYAEHAWWASLDVARELPAGPRRDAIEAAILARLRGEQPTIPSSGLIFSQASAAYLAETQRDQGAKLTEHTARQARHVFRLFQEFAGDAPLAAIDRRKASAFLDRVAAGRAISNGTLNRYCSALSAVWVWAGKRGHADGGNPWRGQWRKQSDKGWLPFSIAELNALFASQWFNAEARGGPTDAFSTAMAWLPLIALFSGMRSNEACQLRHGDVIRKDGVWCFRVSADSPGQSLKTAAAARLVPVHSALIKAGFLDHLTKVKAGQLWPALKPGGPDGRLNDYFTKRFMTYRRAAGVTASRLCFHSFRKNAAGAMKDARATPAEIAELIGHEQGFTFSVYARQALPITALQEIVEKIDYPGLAI
jgi:integrase